MYLQNSNRLYICTYSCSDQLENRFTGLCGRRVHAQVERSSIKTRQLGCLFKKKKLFYQFGKKLGEKRPFWAVLPTMTRNFWSVGSVHEWYFQKTIFLFFCHKVKYSIVDDWFQEMVQNFYKVWVYLENIWTAINIWKLHFLTVFNREGLAGPR